MGKTFFSVWCKVVQIWKFVDFISQLRCHRQKVELSRIFHLCRGGQFYWQRTPQYIEKTTNLPEITDELYHIMLYTSPWAGFEITKLVVICTDYTGSCKSNNHMITTMTTTYIFHANIKLHKTEMNMIHDMYIFNTKHKNTTMKKTCMFTSAQMITHLHSECWFWPDYFCSYDHEEYIIC